MKKRIPLIPGVPHVPAQGGIPSAPPEGVILNNTNSNTTIPPHKPVLCSAVLSDGKEDSWLEYVPENLPAGKKPPLIISCHGGGANADLQFSENSWWCVCEAEGAIAVFPNAGGQTRSWLSEDKPPEPGTRPSMLDVFTASPDGRASEENHHIKFIKALIGEMKKKYDIDEGRVYMQGMSMGDIMTMMFSRVCGNLLAAADCTAGPSPEVALFNEDGSLKGYKCPVPMYQSRGELDNIVIAQRPGQEVTTRQDVNAGNREFWLRVNECDDLPRLSILGVNNFAFFTGKKANVVYRDVKHRGHGQTLDDSFWAWETLFKGCRRNPDGSVTCVDTEATAGDKDAAAFCDGASYAYIGNKKYRLEGPVFSEALTNFNFTTREMEEVKRDLYVPVSALSQVFGVKVKPTQEGKAALIETPKGKCEVAMESAACMFPAFLRAMFMPARQRDGVLYIPIRWFAEEIFGMHVTECDGALYISDHHGEMSKDMAYLIRQILA